MVETAPMSVYDTLGGDQFFLSLVNDFYEAVAEDPLLRPMYPEDLHESRSRLAGFLIQYWGGPTIYSDQRGHPRLRMRHMPFKIDQAAADAWLTHMMAALAKADPPDEIAAAMAAHFEHSANFLINSD